VWGRRRRLIPTAWLVVLVVLILQASATVREVRNSGFSNFDWSNTSAGVTDGMIELGGSLMPVYVAAIWQDKGQGLLWGDSYWAPFDRILQKYFLDRPVPEAEDDPRILDIVTRHRYGPIAFSVIAEAYANFGLAGVALLMAGLGAALTWSDRLPSTPFHNAMLGVILVPLFTSVRNAFISVPGKALVGVAIVVALGLVSGAPRHWRERESPANE
jgi:hypothetical protein